MTEPEGVSEQAMGDVWTVAKTRYGVCPCATTGPANGADVELVKVVPLERAVRAERALADCKEALTQIRDWDDESVEFLADVEVELKTIARDCLARLGSEAGE